MIRYLLLPWRPAPLLLVGTFSVGFLLAVWARLAGILLAFLLISWFFKYCFVLLDAVVAGEAEPPVLSVEMVNPFDEQRPLAQAIIIVAGWMLVTFIGAKAGRPARAFSAALLLAVLPASVAVLGVTRNPFHAVSPRALAVLIRGAAREYAVVLLATLVCAAVLYAAGRFDLPLLATFALGQLAFLTVFALIGGAVHENRFALGVATRTREERRLERELLEHAAARKRMLDESYTSLRLGRVADAWSEIERWLLAHCPDAADHRPRMHQEYPALIESAERWGDHRIADRLTNDYLGRLLAARENGRALDVLERRVTTNPDFRPAQPAHAARLRELAALAGKRALHRLLTGSSRADD